MIRSVRSKKLSGVFHARIKSYSVHCNENCRAFNDVTAKLSKLITRNMNRMEHLGWNPIRKLRAALLPGNREN